MRAIVAALGTMVMLMLLPAADAGAQPSQVPPSKPSPFDRLFRGQLKPAEKMPQPRDYANTNSMFQTPPVCMPVIHGDSSIDPSFMHVHVPPPNGPTPIIKVVPAPPCRK